jgi:hypothetical protein
MNPVVSLGIIKITQYHQSDTNKYFRKTLHIVDQYKDTNTILTTKKKHKFHTRLINVTQVKLSTEKINTILGFNYAIKKPNTLY